MKYDNASLVQIPSGYKASTLYSVLPANGNGDFTHTRGSSATRVNENGLIESVGSNVPRLDYPLLNGVVQDCPALLLEPSRTNLVTYSEDFTNAAWTKIGAGTGTAASITANAGTSPDGNVTADRLVCDLNGGTTSGDQSLIYDSITGSGDTVYSIYVKSNTSSSQNFSFGNDLNGYASATATTEWQRFDYYKSTAVSQNIYIGTRGTTGSDDTLDLLIWGAQVEAATYATSYIPTSGTTVTRAAETCNGAGTSAEFNDSEGVLFAEISALADDGTSRVIAISDGTLNNRVLIYYVATSNEIRGNCVSGGVAQALLISSISDATSNTKIAYKYKANDFSVWINGFETAIDISGVTPTGLSELAFDDGGGTYPMYGNTKQVATFNVALSDTQLEDLTSWDSFAEMAQSQLYTIE